MRRLLIVPALLAALLGMALLAAWQAPRFLDWDRYRTTVERVASAGLGRPVRIAGPIRLSLLPQATLRARDVTVADTGDGAAAAVGELRMRVGLSALLTGRVEPQDLVLQDARMRLPWPPAGFTLGTPPPGELHARVENGTLLLGDFAITGISGELSAGGPDHALAASGLATVLGRPWRMTGRLGRAGSDGSATVAVSLDGQGTGVGTGVALAGQVAADGSVSGRITGRGPDLSLLLPAPSQPWNADGRVVAGSGLLVADDLEVTIGGSPARGAVALRLLPQLRLDAALATNRLDLDAWLPPLLHGGPVALPTGIDLSAEAASLAGGILRRLRAGFELTGGSVALRESSVVLPGDAPLQLSGVLTGTRFAGDARLRAPDFAQLLAWLRPLAPSLLNAVPLDTLHTASLAATVQADGGTVSLGGLHGDVDGVALTGNVAVHGGPRPAVAADLQLAGPVLDRWVPEPPQDMAHVAAALAGLPKWAAGFDADVTIAALHPVWHGAAFDRLDVAGAARAGTIEVRRAALGAAGLSATLSGSIDGALRIADGNFAVRLAQAEPLAGWLPPGWQFARPLFRGPVEFEASVAGPFGAWATVAGAELADARLQANGRWNLAGHRWAGSVSLHHPGARRLLSALGLAGLVGWLGDGSLSLQGALDAATDRVALDRFELSAGALRSTGTLTLAWPGADPPGLTGSLDIDTLPILLPYLRSTNPLGFDVLRTANATLAIRADHLSWGAGTQGDAASARVRLAGGVLQVDDIAAHLGGGALAGRLTVNAAGTPRLSATAALTGTVLDGAVFDTALDLVAGTADVSLDVTASGYSPAALFASLNGALRASITGGALSGLDGGALLSALQADAGGASADVATALGRGATPFTRMDVAGTIGNGLLTLFQGTITAPSVSVHATGSVDLPGAALDLTLALQPALEGAPAIGARLIGPAANPSRTPDLAELTRWLGAR